MSIGLSCEQLIGLFRCIYKHLKILAPGGDLQNDTLIEAQQYIEISYEKTEEMLSLLENCAQELKVGKEISYACQATAILNK